MPYIEHQWLSEGALVSIPSQNMLGLIKCIPSGLIVTNNEFNQIDRKSTSFQRNPMSQIWKKHPADLDGFVDIEVVRIGDNWRDPDDPLCQSFAVTDLKQCDENDQAMYMSMRDSVVDNVKSDMDMLVQKVEEDLSIVRSGKPSESGMSPSQALESAVSGIKSLQETLSKFKSGKKKLDPNDMTFAKEVGDKMIRWNREIRGLRAELRMKGMK